MIDAIWTLIRWATIGYVLKGGMVLLGDFLNKRADTKGRVKTLRLINQLSDWANHHYTPELRYYCWCPTCDKLKER